MANRHDYESRNVRDDFIEDVENTIITLILMGAGLAGCYQMRTMKYIQTDPATSTTRIAQQSPLTEKDFLLK